MTLLDSAAVAPGIRTAPAEEAPHRFALTLTCPERPGIVHAVTSFLLEHGFNIDEHQQFDDPVSRTLYLRTAFSGDTATTAGALADEFREIAGRFSMSYRIHDQTRMR